MDDTDFISASTSTYIPATHNRNNNDLPIELDSINDFYPNKSLDLLVENILVYIAEYVVRKALKHITCDVCRSALVAVLPLSGHIKNQVLFQMRYEGGLCAEGVIKIIKSSEKNLRLFTEVSKTSVKLTSLTLQGKVLSDVGHKDLFGLSSHFSETQSGLSNHFTDIIRSVVDIFFTIRQHHIVRLQNMRTKGISLRSN